MIGGFWNTLELVFAIIGVLAVCVIGMFGAAARWRWLFGISGLTRKGTRRLYDFTEGARQSLAAARAEAVRLQQDFVAPEHILFGVLSSPAEPSTLVLRNLGADPAQLRADILAVEARGARNADPDLPYTQAAKDVLTSALREARELGHPYVGSEHLLLGLFCDQTSIAATVLAKAGLRVDTVRAETRRMLAA